MYGWDILPCSYLLSMDSSLLFFGRWRANLSKKWVPSNYITYNHFRPVPESVSCSLFSADIGMERHWCSQFSWCNKSRSGTVDVGDIAPWSKNVEFRAIFLHPSTLHCLRHLSSHACGWLRLQHGCWRHLSFHAWSFSEIHSISKEGGYNLSYITSLWNSGASTF